jgi:hypothetical protein
MDTGLLAATTGPSDPDTTPPPAHPHPRLSPELITALALFDTAADILPVYRQQGQALLDSLRATLGIAREPGGPLPDLAEHTVTVAGPERHDGEKPYTYVLWATDLDAARTLALAHHIIAQELTFDWHTGGWCHPDAQVVEGEGEDTFTGVPAWPSDEMGRAWSDLRTDPLATMCALLLDVAA